MSRARSARSRGRCSRSGTPTAARSSPTPCRRRPKSAWSYVAAFAPDEGELLGEILAKSEDSVLTSAVLELQFPTGDGTATELIVDPAKFRDVFTADLPAWAAVGTEDKAAGTDVVHWMAERAGPAITDAPGSQVIMISQPDAVTEVILTALKAVSEADVAVPA